MHPIKQVFYNSPEKKFLKESINAC